MASTGTGGGLCPVLATPQNGILTEQNVNSLAVDTFARTAGTKVEVSCYWSESYRLQGSDQVTCVGGRWEPDPPVCVRKNAGSEPDSGNTTTSTITPSPDEDTYTIVLILVAVTCVVVVTVLLLVFITRRCCRRDKYNHMKEDLPGDGSSFFSAPGYAKSLNRHRADGDQTRWSFRPKAPPSLWSVPPSQRQWPASYVHGSQQRDRPVGVRGPASVSVQATWRGLESREWTYLSVDRLLRDIEMSRRNNPNHSWRDFASLSTEPAQSAKKARRL